MKSVKYQIFIFLVLACSLITTCENTVIEKWWEESAQPSELYVDGVLKMKAKLPAIFGWIKNNITDNAYCIVRVGMNDSLSPDEGRLHYSGKKGIIITLSGIDTERTITISGSARGSLFDVGENVTLILSENITLKGHNENNKAIVIVSSGGTLAIKDGAKITGNNNIYDKIPWAEGGGTEPEAANGGGICVIKGNLTIDGGEICGNKANLNGAGIMLFDSTCIMNRGKIYNNEAVYDGGGINVTSSVFTMRGGEIYGNKAGWGGGVRVNIKNTSYYFTKEPPEGSSVSGIIYGSDASSNLANKATTYGDAVAQYGTFAAKRDRTLYENDSISTTNRNVGWD